VRDDDAALQKRHDDAASKLAGTSDELQQVTEELEQLVDSFTQVTKEVPELAERLSAMKLCVGALASARRLERAHESLQEPKDISAALTEALLRLASTLSSRAQVNARPLSPRGERVRERGR